jgi:hypothetical protein
MCPLCVVTTAILAFGAMSTGGLVARALGKESRRAGGLERPARSSSPDADHEGADDRLPADLR